MAESRTIKKAFSIVNLYLRNRPSLGVSEVAAELGLNKATVSRLMATLALSGIMYKNAKDGRYYLTSVLVEFARVYLSSLDLETVAIPYMTELNQKINENVTLHILKENKRFILTRIDTTRPVRVVYREEDRYGPLHAGAPGKLLLAFLPDKMIDEILNISKLEKYTHNTITDREKLKLEIEKIRKQGYATSKMEHMDLLGTVSAPIRDFQEKVIGALCITWLLGNSNARIEQHYLALVRDTALRISREMGGQNLTFE